MLTLFFTHHGIVGSRNVNSMALLLIDPQSHGDNVPRSHSLPAVVVNDNG